MTDIVERLRARAAQEHEMLGDIHIPLLEAADEIDRLRANLEAADIAVSRLNGGAELQVLMRENNRLRAERAETDIEFGILQNDLGKALLEIDRLRAVLEEIRDCHVPDQPSCLDIDEADYIRRQHAELRRIARAALEAKA